MKLHAVLESKWQGLAVAGACTDMSDLFSSASFTQIPSFQLSYSYHQAGQLRIGVYFGSLLGIHLEGLVYIAWRLAPVPGTLW